MPIDLLCVIVLGLGFWQGYNRGIIQLAFNVISYVFGVTLAFKMTPAMTTVLENLFKSTNPLMFLAGFLVNLAIVMIIVRYAAKGLEGIFEFAYMGTINQVLGGVFYGGISVLLFSVLVWFGDKALMIDDATKLQSRTFPLLKQLPGEAREIAVRLTPVFSEIWNTSVAWMDKMKQYGPKTVESKPKYYDIEEDDKARGGIEDYPEEVRPKPKPKQQPPPTYDGSGIEND